GPSGTLAGHDRHPLLLAVSRSNRVLAGPPAVDGLTQHPDAVLELRESLIRRRGRGLVAGQRIHLVRGEHDPRAYTAREFLLESVHFPERRDGVLSAEDAELRKSLAMLREPHGHDRDRRHARVALP